MDKIVVNNSIKVHYKVLKGNALTLVLLHGGGGSMSAWGMILPYLQRLGFTIILLDLRGHGFSDRPLKLSDYSFESHAKDVLCVLQKEKKKRVILIGHCLGSMVATVFASLYPQYAEKLILINTGYSLPKLMKNFFIRYCLLFFLRTMAYFPIFQKPGRVDYGQYVGTTEISLRRLFADIRSMTFLSAYFQYKAGVSWNGFKYYSTLSCPVYLVISERDMLYSPSYMRRLTAAFPHFTVSFLHSNHISVINNPQGLYEKIAAFL